MFVDDTAASNRRSYIQEIGKRAPILAEYDYAAGPVLVRVSKQLTPKQAAEYETALSKIEK